MPPISFCLCLFSFSPGRLARRPTIKWGTIWWIVFLLFHPPKNGLEILINKNITINDYVYNDLPIDYNGKEVRVGLGADGLVKLSVSAFFVMKLNVCYPKSHAIKLSVGRFIGVPSPQKIGQSLKSLASMRSSKTCQIWLHPTTHRCVFFLSNFYSLQLSKKARFEGGIYKFSKVLWQLDPGKFFTAYSTLLWIHYIFVVVFFPLEKNRVAIAGGRSREVWKLSVVMRRVRCVSNSPFCGGSRHRF